MARVVKVGTMVRRESGPKPLEVEKWQDEFGVNLLLAEYAQCTAFFAQALHELIEELQKPANVSKFPAQPERDVWLSMYREPFEYYRLLGDRLGGRNVGRDSIAAYGMAQDVGRRIDEDPESVVRELEAAKASRLRRQFIRSIKEAHRQYREHLRGLRADIKDRGKALRSDFGKQLAKFPELHFFLAVYVPCIVHFSTTPGRLFDRAINGDTEAIENLVRLDSRTAHDPALDKWIYQVSGNIRAGRSEMVAGWSREGIKKRLTPLSIKQSAAGLISAMGERFGARLYLPQLVVKRYKLSAPQIADLFHAMARDFGRADGAGRDPDLDNPVGETWAKMVQRRSVPWIEGLEVFADKSSRNSCPGQQVTIPAFSRACRINVPIPKRKKARRRSGSAGGASPPPRSPRGSSSRKKK